MKFGSAAITVLSTDQVNFASFTVNEIGSKPFGRE